MHTSPYLPTYSPITSGYTRKLGTHTTHSPVLILPYSCLTPCLTPALILPYSCLIVSFAFFSCLTPSLLLPYSCLTPALLLPYSCLTPAMLLSCFYLTLALILPCSFLPCFCINPTQLLSSASLAPWPLFASFLLLVSTLTLLYSAVLVLLWSCVADVLPVIFLMSYTSPPIPILLLPCPSCRSLRNVHDNSSLKVQCDEISWPQLFV